MQSRAASQYALEITARGMEAEVDRNAKQDMLAQCGATPLSVQSNADGVCAPVLPTGTGANVRHKFRFGENVRRVPSVTLSECSLENVQPSSTGALGSGASAEAVSVAAAFQASESGLAHHIWLFCDFLFMIWVYGKCSPRKFTKSKICPNLV